VAKTPHQFRGIEARGGKQRILFAEVNPAMRELTGEFLQNAWYELLTAKDGLEAVDLFGRNQNSVDPLLDVVMPGHNGSEAFARINRLRPEIR
jgi:CheY-like chemotaxis protein